MLRLTDRLMKTLTQIDNQLLQQSIQQIYTFGNLDEFGANALSIIDRLVPSDVPIFHKTDVRTNQVWHTYLPGKFFALTPELIGIHERTLPEHPIAQRMPQTLDGAYKISDFVNLHELHALEGIYQDFLRVIGIEEQLLMFLPTIQADNWNRLARSQVTLNGFVLCRPTCSFTERDRSMLNILRPHLIQAYTNAQEYDRLQQQCDFLQQSLNCLSTISIDPDGLIVAVTSSAIHYLETYFALSTGIDRIPEYLWAWVQHQILNLDRNTDLPNTCTPLRIQKQGKELTIRLIIESSKSQYLLLLEERKITSSLSLELLDLSARETSVLTCIIQGKSNKAISTHLNMSFSTVRKHLESIYAKLGANSRSDAIAITLRKLGALTLLLV